MVFDNTTIKLLLLLSQWNLSHKRMGRRGKIQCLEKAQILLPFSPSWNTAQSSELLVVWDPLLPPWQSLVLSIESYGKRKPGFCALKTLYIQKGKNVCFALLCITLDKIPSFLLHFTIFQCPIQFQETILGFYQPFFFLLSLPLHSLTALPGPMEFWGK